MPDNNELPEGTDKIIGGASRTTSSSDSSGGGGASPAIGTSDEDGEVLVVTETSVATIVPAETSGSAGASTGTPSGAGESSGGGVIDKLLSSREKISGQAAGKARDLVGQGLERSAEALANVGRMVGETATGLDERLGEEYGDYARRAASAIEEAANNIAAKDTDALIEDTRNFVRKSPAVALAGAAVVGFALARLIKTGLSGGDEDDDQDAGRSGRSSKA